MQRELYSTLSNYLEQEDDHRVIMIEGARQVGKSYLVKDVLAKSKKNVLSFDLEKDKLFRKKLDSTRSFNDFKTLLEDQYNLTNNSILFIDEAQESKALSAYIKSFKEDWSGVRVILTGSSMNRFFSATERIPVGRTRSLCVFGFSFTEFVKFIKGDTLADFLNSAPEKVENSRHEYLLSLYDDYMYIGGYPEAVKAYASGNEYKDVIEEIIISQEEDFERKESEDPELFRMALESVSNFIGSPSKFSYLKTSLYKAKKIIEAMKAWHLILEVKPQSLNPLHSNFLPKRYLYDVGVVNLLRAQPVPTLSMLTTLTPELRTPLGGLFENAALINLLHGKPAKKSIFTWKKDSKTNVEVDFILDTKQPQGKIPIECKAALYLKKKHFTNLLQYLRLSGQKIGILISAAPLQTTNIDDIKIINIPIYLATEANIKMYIK